MKNCVLFRTHWTVVYYHWNKLCYFLQFSLPCKKKTKQKHPQTSQHTSEFFFKKSDILDSNKTKKVCKILEGLNHMSNETLYIMHYLDNPINATGYLMAYIYRKQWWPCDIRMCGQKQAFGEKLFKPVLQQLLSVNILFCKAVSPFMLLWWSWLVASSKGLFYWKWTNISSIYNLNLEQNIDVADMYAQLCLSKICVFFQHILTHKDTALALYNSIQNIQVCIVSLLTHIILKRFLCYFV